MKLYYSPGACSLAVRITLNELGIPFETEAVDLKTKKTATGADYLKINPKGAVPVLVLDSKEILSENAVLHQYLADTYKRPDLLAPIGDIKRYRTLEWLNFISTDLHKGFGPFFNPQLPQEIKTKFFAPAIEKKLDLTDEHLAKHKFLLGDQFTVADAYLFVILSWLPHFNMELARWPNLSRYMTDLKHRKSVAKSLQEEHL